MIKVTRFNNQEIFLNPHLIEAIEATPDTVVTLTSGTKFVVKDSVPELIERLIAYRKSINGSCEADCDGPAFEAVKDR